MRIYNTHKIATGIISVKHLTCLPSSLTSFAGLATQAACQGVNPAYYSTTGFKPISTNVVNAPFPLSQPMGWLAQSFDGKPIQVMEGATYCVEALNDPRYW
jgi:predicted N-acetyltransferase YhbS